MIIDPIAESIAQKEAVKAVADLSRNQCNKKVVRCPTDPNIPNQTVSLFSFIPHEKAQPSPDGKFGLIKVRENWENAVGTVNENVTEIETIGAADKKAEEQAREIVDAVTDAEIEIFEKVVDVVESILEEQNCPMMENIESIVESYADFKAEEQTREIVDAVTDAAIETAGQVVDAVKSIPEEQNCPLMDTIEAAGQVVDKMIESTGESYADFKAEEQAHEIAHALDSFVESTLQFTDIIAHGCKLWFVKHGTTKTPVDEDDAPLNPIEEIGRFIDKLLQETEMESYQDFKAEEQAEEIRKWFDYRFNFLNGLAVTKPNLDKVIVLATQDYLVDRDARAIVADGDLMLEAIDAVGSEIDEILSKYDSYAEFRAEQFAIEIEEVINSEAKAAEKKEGDEKFLGLVIGHAICQYFGSFGLADVSECPIKWRDAMTYVQNIVRMEFGRRGLSYDEWFSHAKFEAIESALLEQIAQFNHIIDEQIKACFEAVSSSWVPDRTCVSELISQIVSQVHAKYSRDEFLAAFAAHKQTDEIRKRLVQYMCRENDYDDFVDRRIRAHMDEMIYADDMGIPLYSSQLVDVIVDKIDVDYLRDRVAYFVNKYVEELVCSHVEEAFYNAWHFDLEEDDQYENASLDLIDYGADKFAARICFDKATVSEESIYYVGKCMLAQAEKYFPLGMFNADGLAVAVNAIFCSIVPVRLVPRLRQYLRVFRHRIADGSTSAKRVNLYIKIVEALQPDSGAQDYESVYARIKPILTEYEYAYGGALRAEMRAMIDEVNKVPRYQSEQACHQIAHVATSSCSDRCRICRNSESSSSSSSSSRSSSSSSDSLDECDTQEISKILVTTQEGNEIAFDRNLNPTSGSKQGISRFFSRIFKK